MLCHEFRHIPTTHSGTLDPHENTEIDPLNGEMWDELDPQSVTCKPSRIARVTGSGCRKLSAPKNKRLRTFSDPKPNLVANLLAYFRLLFP